MVSRLYLSACIISQSVVLVCWGAENKKIVNHESVQKKAEDKGYYLCKV